MSAGDHPARPGADLRDPLPASSHRPPALTFLIVLTLVVVGFAVVVALWMYWLGGALRV